MTVDCHIIAKYQVKWGINTKEMGNMRQLIKQLQLPMTLKLLGIVLLVVFIVCCLCFAVPAFILLLAFPKLWIAITVLAVLLAIGYIKGRQ